MYGKPESELLPDGRGSKRLIQRLVETTITSTCPYILFASAQISFKVSVLPENPDLSIKFTSKSFQYSQKPELLSFKSNLCWEAVKKFFCYVKETKNPWLGHGGQKGLTGIC